MSPDLSPAPAWERPCPEGPFLAGRVALVTGSSKRLGRHLAETLAGLGASVAVHYRHSEDEARAVVEAIRARGGQAEAFRADVTVNAECEALVRAVVAHFGGLHVLVNNVGDYLEKNILDNTPADWHGMLDSNLHSTFYMCQAALPVMRGQAYARILNLGFASCGQVNAHVHSTAYSIAKTGVLILTKSLASSLRDDALTVNMISPGVLEHSITHPPLKDVPKGRWGQASEMAAAMTYLLTPLAGYVTGQHLEVAGGWHL